MIITDVLTSETAVLYRSVLDRLVVVRLLVSFQTSLDRARGRSYQLTEKEMRDLHEQQAAFLGFDIQVDTEQVGLEVAAGTVGALLD